jgi:hypothetical protein
MQRKQQVGECWVCVIFFARVVVYECMRRARRGVRGGAARFLIMHMFLPIMGIRSYMYIVL